MDKVWILEAGEDYEGGSVLGVYAKKEFAYEDFVKAATERGCFGIYDREVWSDKDDDSVHAHAGCDWISLSLYEVRTRPEIGR